jgi:hypothetical protein
MFVNLVFENTLNDVKDIIMNFIKKEAMYGNGTDALDIMYENNVKMNISHDDEDKQKNNKNESQQKTEECKHEEELKERIAKTFVPMMEVNKISNNSTNETLEIEEEKFEQTTEESNAEEISPSDANKENTNNATIKNTQNNNSTDILIQISQQLLQINSLN